MIEAGVAYFKLLSFQEEDVLKAKWVWLGGDGLGDPANFLISERMISPSLMLEPPVDPVFLLPSLILIGLTGLEYLFMS